MSDIVLVWQKIRASDNTPGVRTHRITLLPYMQHYDKAGTAVLMHKQLPNMIFFSKKPSALSFITLNSFFLHTIHTTINYTNNYTLFSQ